MNKISLLGTNIDAISKSELVSRLLRTVEQHQLVFRVYTPNPEIVLYANQHHEYREVLNQAEIAIPDAIGIQMGAELMSRKMSRVKCLRFLQILYHGLRIGLMPFSRGQFRVIPERIPGSELLIDLLNENGQLRIFLLGGESEEINQSACRKIQGAFSHSQVSGLSGGVIGIDGYGSEDSKLIESIKKFNPDVLLVGFGHPKQEMWIHKHLSELPPLIAIGVGGTIDFFAGVQKRAPQSWAHYGMEWLYRLFQNPKRLHRILSAFPIFPLFIAQYKLRMVE